MEDGHILNNDNNTWHLLKRWKIQYLLLRTYSCGSQHHRVEDGHSVNIEKTGRRNLKNLTIQYWLLRIIPADHTIGEWNIATVLTRKGTGSHLLNGLRIPNRCLRTNFCRSPDRRLENGHSVNNDRNWSELFEIFKNTASLTMYQLLTISTSESGR